MGDERRETRQDPFGVVDWRSYAFAAAGAVQHERGNWENARRLYLSALERDGDNRLALVNIANIDLRRGVIEDSSSLVVRAGAWLERVLEICDRGVGVSTVEIANESVGVRRDGLWFRAAYNLSCVRVVQDETEDASTTVTDLVRQVVGVLDPEQELPDARDVGEGVYRREMCAFVRDLAPQAVVVAAGINRVDPKPELEAALRAYLDHPQEGATTSSDVVEHVERLEPNYRARYNIACYYSRLGDDADGGAYDRALSNLRFAAQAWPDDLKEWARADPALKGLRRHRRTPFRQITGMDATADEPKDPDPAPKDGPSGG